MLYFTIAEGAIVVEWNIHDPEGQQGAAGMWDSHIILGSLSLLLLQNHILTFVLGGAAGTNLEKSKCIAGSNSNPCFASFLGLHLTCGSSAYLEVVSFFCTMIHSTDQLLLREPGYGLLIMISTVMAPRN